MGFLIIADLSFHKKLTYVYKYVKSVRTGCQNIKVELTGEIFLKFLNFWRGLVMENCQIFRNTEFFSVLNFDKLGYNIKGVLVLNKKFSLSKN